MSRSIAPLFRELQIAWYRWALSEMPATHPDVPYVVMRLRCLLDEPGPQPMRAVWRWL